MTELKQIKFYGGHALRAKIRRAARLQGKKLGEYLREISEAESDRVISAARQREQAPAA